MHDRRNRFFGKNSGAKIGYVVSAGRRPWDTPTVAGLRRRRLNPHGAKARNISSRIVGFRKAETWPARHVAP